MTKIKNVLVSAYACEPNKGSEPGIGWHWVIELAKLEYNVKVITRTNNRENIEIGLNKLQVYPNLKFYYYDLPKWIRVLKNLPFGIYFYYFFWQIGILSVGREILKESKVDVVHHITFGVFRQASFLWKLKTPFVFGPVGGAEMTPHKLLISLPFIEYIKEILRVIVNYTFKLSPPLNKMLKNTDLILCKTQDTLNFLPKKYSSKSFVEMDIGTTGVFKNEKIKFENKNKLKVLYVGRFIGWKGVHLAIDAVNKTNNDSEKIELTLIGKGKLKKYLEQKAKSESIKFIDWVTQEELFEYYSSFDCFLFPSFHDSSGSVILEAYSFGLPVISLNLGGPDKLVQDDCGFKIDVIGKTFNQVTSEMAELLLKIHVNREILKPLKAGAFEKAEYYKWGNSVKRTYQLIENKI
jgi:glycosyltransferase involved in cell wall biosynthesis